MRKTKRTYKDLYACLKTISECDNSLKNKFKTWSAGAKAWTAMIRKRNPEILGRVYGLKRGTAEKMLDLMDTVAGRADQDLAPEERYIPVVFYAQKPPDDQWIYTYSRSRPASAKSAAITPPQKGYWHYLPIRPSHMLETILPRDGFNRPEPARMTDEKWRQLDAFKVLFAATLKSRRGRPRKNVVPEMSPDRTGILYLCLGKKQSAHGHYQGKEAYGEWLAVKLLERLGRELNESAQEPVHLSFKRASLSLYGKSHRKSDHLSPTSSTPRVLALKVNRFLSKVGVLLDEDREDHKIHVTAGGFQWLPPYESLQNVKRLSDDYNHKPCEKPPQTPCPDRETEGTDSYCSVETLTDI